MANNNRVSNTVFSFFFFSWHKYFSVEGLVEKSTLSSMLVSPSITNTAPRHFVIKSVFWKTEQRMKNRHGNTVMTTVLDSLGLWVGGGVIWVWVIYKLVSINCTYV